MDVLVVGYGKIGRIKAFIWHSLGRGVYVYDTDDAKKQQAVTDGFGIHKEGVGYSVDLIVDISTPASCHVMSLEWVLNSLNVRPRTFLVEKPIVSHQSELDRLDAILSGRGMDEYRNKIVINESYYFSSALRFVTDDIKKRSLCVKGVHVELSKNRMDDVRNGRFTDEHLGSLGIELPHMIALVQGLGFDLDRLDIKNVNIFLGPEPHNEGFRIDLQSGDVSLVMESYLGSFRVSEDGSRFANDQPMRTLKAITDSLTYEVSFDPVPDLERYKALIRIHGKDGSILDEVVVADDHLAAHLKKIHQNDKDLMLDHFLEIDNSIKITQYIFDLMNRVSINTTGTT